jgi:hypothetical protein
MAAAEEFGEYVTQEAEEMAKSAGIECSVEPINDVPILVVRP